MAARKKLKKVTYGEFLAWLEGVESMQEDGWTPTSTQWATIREKLNSVKPDVTVIEKTVEVADNVAAPVHSGQPMAQFVEHPSAMDAAPVTQQQPPPRMQLSAHQQHPPVAEGVPSATTGPFLDADGNLPAGGEFL